MMNRRPKPGDDEDEILRMQEEFLKEKNKNQNLQPAASVVNLRPTKRTITEPSKTGTKKLSKYALAKGLKLRSENGMTIEETACSVLGNIVEKNTETPRTEIEDDNVYFPKPIPSLLGDIIEKNSDHFEVHNNLQSFPSKGFPAVTKADFTQKLDKSTQVEINELKMDMEQQSSSQSCLTDKPLSTNLTQQSTILSPQDTQQIHNDNLKIIKKMTETEILEEQQKLLATLDPKLINFLKVKRKQVSFVTEAKSKVDEMYVTEMDTSPCNETVKNTTIENENIIEDVKPPENDSLWENDVLSHPELTKWLHFDSLEKDKLEWMKGIEKSKAKTNEPYEARFNFDGYLLPYTMDYTEKTKTLFHHGDEPDRPGYSLTELFELTRSAVTQQRVMSLNTIAGMLNYNMVGTYKGILELPLNKIFFIIRVAMDENKVVILEPALRAMRNMIYNRVDEVSIDAMLGSEECNYQPCLENDMSIIQDLDSTESEFKDFHLAEIDLIATAILRTDILQRLYYILEIIKPNYNCIQYCLQILTRLARDSVETATKIVQTDHLMQTVVKNFVPVTSINFMFDSKVVYNGKPNSAALKFLRVLSLQSNEIAQILVTKYNILNPLNEYISSGVEGNYGLGLQTEAFCIMTNLLQFQVINFTENILPMMPLIVTTLYKHVQGTDVNVTAPVLQCIHAAMVLQLVNTILKITNSCSCNLYPLIKEGTQKWLTQFALSEHYCFVHIKLICQVLICCKTMILKEKLQMKFLNDSLKMLIASRGFKPIINNLESCSNLLSGIEKKDLHFIKNIMSLEGSLIHTELKVLPILTFFSPIPFLKSLFDLLPFIEDNTLSLNYLEKVTAYLKKLEMKPPALCENWFTRVEMDFVLAIVKLSTRISIPESHKDLLYSVANKLCYILRSDKRNELGDIFENIVFNKQWFTAERLMNLVTLSDSHGISTISSIEDIKLCYNKVININNTNSDLILTPRQWQEPALPRDWIYLPILTLYSKSQETIGPKVFGEHAKKVERQMAIEKEILTRCSLEWILFNELCFPDLLKDISVTDRFCRIMCVFLSDSSLFLEPKIKTLLEKCTQTLFKHKEKFNFDKPLTGLSNFQDFYTQFLEQFQSVSYGDHTFAACVLVPLAQRHNDKWRKLLWSEYAGCLRALDCPEELLCYELSEYLHPEETEESLIKSYMQALSSNLLRPNTIAHTIASHHADDFKKRTSQEKTIIVHGPTSPSSQTSK